MKPITVTYDDKTLTKVGKMIRDGSTEATVAKHLGISQQTFIKHKKEFPELDATIQSALKDVESEVVGYLMQMIRNPNHKNHASSVYFYLKTRCRWRETDPIPQTITAPKGFAFKLVESPVQVEEESGEDE